jgi:ribonuclease Z
MRPLFHPNLVNGRNGDPTVYVETLFEKRSLLFDIGEISSLSPRKIRRIDQVFVSHEHVDHFVGFDHLLRLLVGHEKSVQLFGPSGFTERVFHKLQAYRWNLVETYSSDLVSELEAANSILTTRFRLRRAFAAEPSVSRNIVTGVLCDEPTHRVSAVILEHGTPCLAFALQEAAPSHGWMNRPGTGLFCGPCHDARSLVGRSGQPRLTLLWRRKWAQVAIVENRRQ